MVAKGEGEEPIAGGAHYGRSLFFFGGGDVLMLEESIFGGVYFGGSLLLEESIVGAVYCGRINYRRSLLFKTIV